MLFSAGIFGLFSGWVWTKYRVSLINIISYFGIESVSFIVFRHDFFITNRLTRRRVTCTTSILMMICHIWWEIKVMILNCLRKCCDSVGPVSVITTFAHTIRVAHISWFQFTTAIQPIFVPYGRIRSLVNCLISPDISEVPIEFCCWLPIPIAIMIGVTALMTF